MTKRIRHLGALAKGGLAILAIATLAATATVTVSHVLLPRNQLANATGFTITSTIDASPACTTTALLYPGVTRCLVYTVHNPLLVPITVSSLSIAGTTVTATTQNTTLPQCTITDLNLSHSSFAGSLTVLAGSTNTASEQISLIDSGNENNCKNATFNFTYTGSATYTEVYATGTAVTSSLNPSAVGQAVTYTAKVTATATGSQDAVPSSPTGAVTFKDGATAICTSVPVSGTTTTTATATCSPAVYLAAATHSITAVYSNSDGNYSGSISPALNQVVNASGTKTVLGSSPNPSTFGQSVTLSATVTATTGPTPTGSVSFYLGSPTGTLLGTGSLNAAGTATFATSGLPGGSDSLYAVYAGTGNDSTSTSAVITQTVNFTSACVTGTTNGGYTVKSGQSICISGRVNGGVTIQSGGSLFLNGASINGSVTSTGATALRFCASTITGNVTISGTTGFIVIGDSGDDGMPGCGANTINGNVTLTNNTGGFEVAANPITGNVSFTSNTGAGPTSENAVPEVEGNKITGSLACATSNIPVITDGGTKNTVSGTKSGECSAAGF